jgi:hypothetical protein
MFRAERMARPSFELRIEIVVPGPAASWMDGSERAPAAEKMSAATTASVERPVKRRSGRGTERGLCHTYRLSWRVAWLI